MKSKIFWGLFLILGGLYLLISQMGYLPGIGVLNTLLTIGCLAVFIKGVLSVSFASMLFPLAIVGILYDECLGITSITPWTILIVALLLTIGLNLIFGKMKLIYFHKTDEDKDKEHFDSVETLTKGEYIQVKSRFGGTIRYITSDELAYVDLEAKFSGIKLYFQDAKAPSGNVTLNLDVCFAGVELYVPKSWDVINSANDSFAGVDEKGRREGEVETVLTLTGSCNFAGVEIHYI